MFNKFYLATACLAALAFGTVSCTDTGDLEARLDNLEDRVKALEETVSQINENATTAYQLHTGGLVVMDVKAYDDGKAYRLDMSDGSSLNIYIAEDGGPVTPVIGIDADGNWTIRVWDDQEPEIIEGMENANGIIPQVRVDENGFWQISTDDGTSWSDITDSEGNKIPATGESITDSFFTSVEYDEAGKSVNIVMDNGQELSLPVYQGIVMDIYDFDMENGESIFLNEPKRFYGVFSDDVKNAYATCPDGWKVSISEAEDGKHMFVVTAPAQGEGDYEILVYLQSDENYLRVYTFKFTLIAEQFNDAYTKSWRDFYTNDPDNVLLDFSYAGYDHGETAPVEVTVTENADGTCTASNGYTVYNIETYGADGTDDLTDREAFINMLTAALGEPETNDAGDQITFPHSNTGKNIVLYFPEGNFILHTSADDNTEMNKSQSIVIRGSNIIFKGAGRDKTTLTMQDPNLPSQGESVMYSSPDMIQFKHNMGIQSGTVLATVTGDSPKGAFSVTVNGTGQIQAGDMVCLYLKNNSQDVVAAELEPYEADQSWVMAGDYGVSVQDLHQVKSVSGNKVTFEEPLMHSIEVGWNWTIVRYQHYENVGIEDLTFAGNAKDKFDHHASWEDDGAYKPVSMTRLVNSWMRRVNFVSVSEACSVIESANVSVYDCEISGTRGHAAIRSQGSSRVFIGAVNDIAQGYRMDDLGHDVTGSDATEVTGQYHAVGVSKESIGAVLWRNEWGSDGCFESHATQPRATLIDCCEGSFRRWRQGGDAVQMPNHLDDLTIWNFNNTISFSGTWKWWDESSDWWKFLPPTIVGFHGQPVTFDEKQTKLIESNGSPVQPESLYEAQLRNRLGYVPGWLEALK